GCGLVVGPRRSTASVRTGGHAFAPGTGAPTGRSWVWFCCRSTALGANGVRHAFAPGAGAPTGRSWDWLCCRSTALGANGSGTHSHPGGVPLRVGVGIGFVVGAPPSVRKGWARIHTRGGYPYGSGLGLVRL